MYSFINFIIFVSVLIPKGNEITLDGIINSSEWSNSKVIELKDGGQAYLHQNDNYLYVGIKGNAPEGWAHIYLPNDKGVLILHASAALGASQYVLSGKDHYQLVEKFNWELRETGLTDEIKAKRNNYLINNGWVASTFKMGNKNEIEFIIEKSLFNQNKIVILFAGNAENPQVFPQTISDDTIKKELVYGSNPDILKFSPSNWQDFEF